MNLFIVDDEEYEKNKDNYEDMISIYPFSYQVGCNDVMHLSIAIGNKKILTCFAFTPFKMGNVTVAQITKENFNIFLHDILREIENVNKEIDDEKSE